MNGWLHVVFNDDPERIFMYRKNEIYRAVLTKKEVELLVEDGNIVVESANLDTLVPEILDETKTTYLKKGLHGIQDIGFYPAPEHGHASKEETL